MKTPDYPTSDLREYERSEAEAEKAWNALAPIARQHLRDEILADPALFLELTIDAIACMDDIQGKQLHAHYKIDNAALGKLFDDAISQQIEGYMDGEAGQKRIAAIVYRLDQEERGL